MEYKIQPGDTLSKIALRYGMTWPELYEYDGGTGKTNMERLNEQKSAKGRPARSIDNPDLIYPDDVILVRDKATPEAATPEEAPPEEEAPEPSAVSSPATGDCMCPNYLVTIGSEQFSLESETHIVSVKVARSMGLPTDSCEVLLVGSEDYGFKKGDAVKVQLGYDNDLKPVFSGLVDSIEHELSTVRVTALGLAVELLRLRLNRVYLNQTAGKIVSNIAQEVKLKVKKASDGISLPIYVIDEAANAYEHILKLAERCNFDAYITEDEQLVFKEWGGSKNNPIQFGKEIIRVEALDFSSLYASTKIFGESPSSMKGSDTSHWLTKQEVKGEAGKGAVLSVHDPAIRDKKTAETVAKAKTTKLEYTFGVAVEAIGKPEIRLGDTVTLEDVPNSALRGQLEVRGIEHYLSKAKGFTTIVNCWMRGHSA